MFFLVISLLLFCGQLFLLCQMALDLLCDRELSEALHTSQEADLFNQPSELSNQILNSITNNAINCKFMDIYDETLNLQNDNNSTILMHLNSKSLQKDDFGLTGSESIWLKIWKNNSTKALVIASIYRHPSEDINQFICNFSDCLEKLSNEKKIFYILGDININIVGTNQLSPRAEKYLQAITRNGAFFLFTKPTRVTDKSAAVIDHTITNAVEHTVMPFVIQSSITDHYAIIVKLVKFKHIK